MYGYIYKYKNAQNLKLEIQGRCVLLQIAGKERDWLVTGTLLHIKDFNLGERERRDRKGGREGQREKRKGRKRKLK